MMKKKYARRSGFVMVLTMLVVSLVVTLTTYIMYRTSMFMPYARTALRQQKARLLATSGIQLAISQLSQYEKPEQKDDDKKKPPVDDAYLARQLLMRVVPHLNQWQRVPLIKEEDGIKGEISFCIGSERGKIDINAVYDFENHQFIDDKKEQTEDEKKKSWRQFFKDLFANVQKTMGSSNLFESFEKFLKQRQYKLDDVTELLQAPGFEIFKNYIFYVPPTTATEGEKAWRPFFLADLFTVASGQDKIDPWLFSDSVRAGLGLNRVVSEAPDKTESARKMMQEKVQNFSLSTDWKKEWDQVLASLYGKEYSTLTPCVASHLATKFEPTIFSVVSYGTFEKVTQRLYALLERTILKQEEDVVIQVKIKKIYWL